MYRSLPIVLATFLAACTDTLVDPSVLQDRSPDGRDSLFATGNAEEQRLAEDIAYAWLDDHGDRVLQGIGDLSTHQVQIRGGRAHVRIAQELDGLPVFHAQSIVHVDADGLVTDMTDAWEHGVAVDTTPTVLEADAVAVAVQTTGGWDFVDGDPDVVLGVLRHATGDHLAFRVRVPRLDGADKPSQLVSFVDAHDGSVIWSYDDLKTATCSATTSYNGAITFPCDLSGGRYQLTASARGAGTFSAGNVWSADTWYLNDVTSSSTRFSSDATSVDAHFGLVSTLDTYAGMFGRDGMDGQGGPVYQDGLATAVTHYGSSYANAYWDGQRMVFGDGDGWSMSALTALDVVGHEFTHGVTEHTAGLVYANQPGALNESMSDVFGAVVEFHQQGAATVWKVGEDAMTPYTAGDALRYMDDPARDGQSADHMSRLYTGGWDNGGVHTNSGIGNLAFQLLSDGGRHPRRASVNEVPGLGIDVAAGIWYAALTERMTPTTDFAGARTATVAAASDLYGADSAEAWAVSAAWAEVGVGSPPSDPGEPDEPGNGGDPFDYRNLSASRGQVLATTLEVPAGATDLLFQISGGTGDADLYVRYGAEPTSTVYDCRPYRSNNDESCSFATPQAGTWYVQVRAYDTFSGVRGVGTYTAPPQAGAYLDVSGLSDTTGGQQRWSFEVAPGQESLVVDIAGTNGDADLYVRQGSAPTRASYDCRPYSSTSTETCRFTNPAPGTWHVMVDAYQSYSGLSLHAE